MSDLISRADAIEAVCRTRCGDKAKGCPAHSCLVIEEFDALPSAETHEIRTETHGVCLISKDDAMGAVQDHFNANGFKGYDDGQKMMDRIKALPSADAVQGWITDRNPTENGTYIVTIADEYDSFVCELHYGEPLMPICKVNGPCWYDSDDEFGDCPYYDILAWQPLPKPYKGGDDK